MQEGVQKAVPLAELVYDLAVGQKAHRVEHEAIAADIAHSVANRARFLSVQVVGTRHTAYHEGGHNDRQKTPRGLYLPRLLGLVFRRNAAYQDTLQGLVILRASSPLALIFRYIVDRLSLREMRRRFSSKPLNIRESHGRRRYHPERV